MRPLLFMLAVAFVVGAGTARVNAEAVTFQAGSYADKISPHGGSISKRMLLSIEGARSPISSKTLFDVLLPVAPPRPQG